jgi:hypothetical protein
MNSPIEIIWMARQNVSVDLERYRDDFVGLGFDGV